MDHIISPEICNSCGGCCKNFPYVDLTKYDINLLQNLTGLRIDEFTNPKDDSIDEHFLKFQENGDCFFLKKVNGNYSCDAYEARPSICKSYPSAPRQYKACGVSKEKYIDNNSVIAAVFMLSIL